jgi:hypothetical protein
MGAAPWPHRNPGPRLSAPPCPPQRAAAAAAALPSPRLTPPPRTPPSTPPPPQGIAGPLALFQLYSYGLYAGVRGGTHLYARSDIAWHGTSHVHAGLKPGGEASAGEPALIGVALYTREDVLADAMTRVMLLGKACTAGSFAEGACWTMPPAGDAERREAAGRQAEAAKRYAAQARGG